MRSRRPGYDGVPSDTLRPPIPDLSRSPDPPRSETPSRRRAQANRAITIMSALFGCMLLMGIGLMYGLTPTHHTTTVEKRDLSAAQQR